MNLQQVDYQKIRHLLGNRAYTRGIWAIDGTPRDIQTSAAIVFSVKGIMYNKPTIAALDVSTLSGLSSTALADGNTQIFGVAFDAAGTVTIVPGEQVATADIAAGTRRADWPEAPSDLVTIVGAVKVVNASGADFVFGTTNLSAAGIADTYYDLAVSSFED